MLVVCVLKKTIHLLQHQDTGCSQISGKKYIQIFAYREFGETHLEFIYSTNPREFVIWNTLDRGPLTPSPSSAALEMEGGENQNAFNFLAGNDNSSF